MASDDEIASPTRRSSRKKARVSYDEDALAQNIQEEKVERPKSRRAPPKKRPVVETFSSGSSSSEEEEEARKPPPAKKRKGGKGRGPAEERTCPHCDQVCSTKSGLKYHIGK